MTKPRAYTEDEVRQQFLEHIWRLIDYWDKQAMPQRRKLEGLAFSILTALDGDSAGICGFIVAPATHPEDMEYLINRGVNYYPQNHDSDIKCDISGGLHELFYRFDPRNTSNSVS